MGKKLMSKWLGSSAHEKKAPATGSKRASTDKHASTRVVVKYDAGLGSALYIRGEGGNLSWDKGQMLKNVAPDEWVWECQVPLKQCEFKLLINDQKYEAGENHRVDGQNAIVLTPRF